MSASVHEWLATRADGVPDALREAIREAVEATSRPGAPVEASLREAARHVMDRAVQGGEDDALALLTADALITYACEIVSERDPGALARLT